MLILLGVLVWGLIWGMVCQSIMRNKGYEETGVWFACGFVLGLIGVIIAACQPNQQAPMTNYYNGQHGSPPSHSRANSTVKCRSCGEINSLGSTHCLSCGTSLSTTSSSRDKSNTWRCSCGAQNYHYETSCHRCGKSKLKATAPKKPEVTTPKPADKSLTEQLEELKKLQEQGLITEADFDAKKKQILNI